MKKFLTVVLAAALAMALAVPAFATNGYQLIGIGANQKSMGGAVTAAPMDAMTAITNPAGMSRVGSRADFSLEAFMPTRSVDFTANGGEKTEGGIDMYGIPAIGWTAPAFDTDNIFFGGGMYGTSGLGVDYEEINMMQGAGLDMMLSGAGTSCFDSTGSAACSDVTFNGFSAIQFWKMAPTVAYNVNDQLSVGFALNMDYQSVAISQTFRNVPWWINTSTGQIDPTCSSAPTATCGVAQDDIIFDIGRPTSQMGFGATIGVLYDINEMFTVGASYSTKQDFDDAEFRAGTGDIYNFSGATGKAGTYKMELDFPSQLSLGVAARPMDKLLVAFDVKMINWSETHDKVKFTGPADSFMTSTGTTTDSVDLPFGWDDQTVIALGVQYEVNEQLRVRAGYNHSEAPIDKADVFSNLVLPATVSTHISFGADYYFGDHWGIAATYMMASEETLTGEGDVDPTMQAMTPFTADSGSKISLEETSLGMQLSYRF